MKIPVELAYLHGPHFHAFGQTGKNLSERLDTRATKDLHLMYDDEAKELEVTWGGRTAHVPDSNVRSYFPFVDGHAPVAKKITPMQSIKAQVATPMDHVFAGPGGGKTK